MKRQFTLAIGHVPATDEVARYQSLYEKCARDGDSAAAVRTVLQAVLLRADAIFRSEIGGTPDARGRRLLTPMEAASAFSLALGHKRMEPLVTAAGSGELATREQMTHQVRAVIDSPDKRLDRSRLLEFFQQYFDYPRATEIFQEKTFPFPEMANEWPRPKGGDAKRDTTLRGSIHLPALLVADTDRLIQRVLDDDKDVLRALLTTDLSFVNLRLTDDKKSRQKDVPVPAFERNAVNNRGTTGPHYVYGFDEWPAEQPVKAHADKPRLGILMQGGVVKFPAKFESGICRARFNPVDGQLYVAGLKGWQTNAAKDGAIQRVRYTGKPLTLQNEIHVTDKGITIGFTGELDTASASDTANYSIQQYNYRWTSAYGSGKYKPSDPNAQGKDPVEVKSVKVAQDRKSVFLEVPGLKPVMQMEIKMNIKSADGAAIPGEVANTINVVPSDANSGKTYKSVR